MNRVHSDLIAPKPITARCLKPGEAATLRIIELENALREVVQAIDDHVEAGRTGGVRDQIAATVRRSQALNKARMVLK